MNLHPLIEKQFKVWGHKTFPAYERWVSIKKFSLLTGIAERRVFDYIKKSKTYHGLLLGNRPLIIHPEEVFKRFAKKQQKELKLLIEEDKSRLELNRVKVSDGIPKSGV